MVRKVQELVIAKWRFRSRSPEPVGPHDTSRPLSRSPERGFDRDPEPTSLSPDPRSVSEPAQSRFSPSSWGLTLRGRATEARRWSSISTSPSQLDPSASSGGPSSDLLGLSIVHDPVDSFADLIFVHGLGGGSRKTWSWKHDPDLYWPSWLQHEQGFLNFRIFSYGYNADWRGPDTLLSILDFSKGLLVRMRGYSGSGDKPIGRQPIIFVTHSMGRLVVKKAYVIGRSDGHYTEMLDKVHGIMFLSTPHQGSALAHSLNNLLTATLGTSQKVYISELKAGSTSLQDLNEQFRGVCDSLQLVSLYETLPTRIAGLKKMIVGKDSGVLNYPKEISSPLNADHHTVCKYRSPDDENYVVVTNLLRQLSQSFETQSPEEDLSQFLHQGMKGSCQGFHNRRSFQDWASNINEANKIFWLGGLPGTGKSTLAGMTIDYLQKTFLPQSCQYHFFIQAQQMKRKVTYCLRSIAFQLACANEIFAGKITRLHEDTGITFGTSTMSTIWEKVYEGIVFKMDFGYTLYWVLDGLDEADASIILVKNLMQMQSRTCIKALFLSRPTKDLSNLATCREDLVTYEVISVTDTVDDIRSYAQAVVHEALPNDGKVQENIIDQVLEKAEGSFLWTKLALNTLRDNWHTQDDIQRALNDVPNDMRSLYKRMVQLIDSQAPRLRQMAVRILTWAACSFRPLKISELEVALSPEFVGFVSLGSTIIQICGHFIRMDNNTVSLIHATARQFLLEPLEGQPPVVGFHDGHERLATVCIRHLSEDRWRRVLTQTPDNTATKVKGDQLTSIYEKHPFLKYAKENWAFHVSRSTHNSEGLLLLLQTFFGKYVLSWIHAVAASNSLRTVTRSAQHLKVFLRRRKRNQSLETPTSFIAADYESRENDARFLGLWITDLIRIVGKFGSNLIENPSTIYRHIPPLCPRNSIIAQTYDREYDSLLSVKKISSGGWDDNLARLTVAQDEMVSRVLCTGSYFITLISSNGTMVVWYAETCEEVRRIHHQEYTTLMCINKSGNLIASAGRFTFRIWDISTGEQLYCWAKDTQARTMSLNFGSSDSELLVGYDDCYAVTYDLTAPGRIRQFAAEVASGDDHSCPRLMVTSPDLTQLAIAYRGRPVLLWDMMGASTQLPRRCIRTEDRDRWDKEKKEVWNAPEVVRWHPNGRSLFILYQDTTLVDWRPIEDEQFEYGRIEAREMVVDQDGTFLLTSNNNGTLSVWTIPRFNLIYRLCYEEFVRDLAFSPDGQRIYDTRGSLCNVWEPDALIRLEEPDRDESSSSCDSFASEPVYAQDDNGRSQITSLTCEYNDEFFCCGRDDGTVSLHEMSNGRKAVYPLLEIRIDETVEQFLFSPDEEKLLISTAFVDRIWSLKEKREICKKRWGSKSGRKWINHPLDEAHILWVDPDELHIYDWKTLRRAATRKTSTIVERREEDDQQSISPIEGQPSFTLTKPVDVQETVYTVAQTSDRRYLICEALPDTGHTRSSSTRGLRLDLLATSDLELHKRNPVRRKNLVQLAQNAQRLLGCYRDRIVFLDQQNWLCTWDVNWPTEDFKRHFFLPKDWLNTSALQLVALNKQGTLLCPRNGEVAITFTIKRQLPETFSLKDTHIRIPARGLGTFQVDPKTYPEGSVKASVLYALKMGYRHIDAALAYGWGSVERDIGAAIRESGINRTKLFVVTKL
ncbi:MAG: hypothetical protein M1840_003228 [Geoglossum simile]|nr:MAG: hypothetical protein M1840_003228 [Geoglossum simile]